MEWEKDNNIVIDESGLNPEETIQVLLKNTLQI